MRGSRLLVTVLFLIVLVTTDAKRSRKKSKKPTYNRKPDYPRQPPSRPQPSLPRPSNPRPPPYPSQPQPRPGARPPYPSNPGHPQPGAGLPYPSNPGHPQPGVGLPYPSNPRHPQPGGGLPYPSNPGHPQPGAGLPYPSNPRHPQPVPGPAMPAMPYKPSKTNLSKEELKKLKKKEKKDKKKEKKDKKKKKKKKLISKAQKALKSMKNLLPFAAGAGVGAGAFYYMHNYNRRPTRIVSYLPRESEQYIHFRSDQLSDDFVVNENRIGTRFLFPVPINEDGSMVDEYNCVIVEKYNTSSIENEQEYCSVSYKQYVMIGSKFPDMIDYVTNTSVTTESYNVTTASNIASTTPMMATGDRDVNDTTSSAVMMVTDGYDVSDRTSTEPPVIKLLMSPQVPIDLCCVRSDLKGSAGFVQASTSLLIIVNLLHFFRIF